MTRKVEPEYHSGDRYRVVSMGGSISRTQARTRQNWGSSDGARPNPTGGNHPGRAKFDIKSVDIKSVG